jgi:hypothetical protein
MTRIPLLLIAAFSLLLGRTAQAAAPEGPLRLAILVGNNDGAPENPPLRFAQDDAERFKQALLAVGGLSEETIWLLTGKGLAELEDAFRAVSATVAESGAHRQVLILFYFSGHSDGTSIELGGTKVPFDRVRAWLEASGATLKVVIVDACRSGRMAGKKGVRLAPEFSLAVHGDLNAEGTAILTSSSANESSQETAEVGGAVFTHHLVSGLYGAADDDGDLRVTLRELYRHAYSRTLGSTAGSLAGPQHPSYGFELEGKGDVVLALVPGQASILSFPAQMPGEYFVLTDPAASMVAQVAQDGRKDQAIFVAPGRYSVLRRHDGSLAKASVVMAQVETRRMTDADFAAVGGTVAQFRGESGADTGWWSAGAFYAMSGWLMPEMGPLHAAGLTLRRHTGFLDYQVRASYGVTSVTEGNFKYDMSVTEISFAPLLCVPFHRFEILAGPVLGTARLRQSASEFGEKVAWSVAPGVLLGAALHPFARTEILLEWEIDLHVLTRDGSLDVDAAPKALVGFGYAF